MDVQLQEANPDAKPAATAAPEGAVADAAGAPAPGEHGGEGADEPKQPSKFKLFFQDLFQALGSPDAPTRKTAILFFASSFCALVVIVIGMHRISQIRAERAREEKEAAAERQRLIDLENNHLNDLKFKEATLSLGRFVVSLKNTMHSDVTPTADFELVVRCSEKEVREYVEARSVQVRSELNSALVGMTREDFLAPDGKRRTHKKIITVLNQWLAREYSGARIEEIWFADLVVE